MIELLTSDLALFLFAAVGIAGTAVSIARDTHDQKANELRGEVPVELYR